MMMKSKMRKALCAVMASSLVLTNVMLSVPASAAGFPNAVNPNMPEENSEITTEPTESNDMALDDAISWLRDHENTTGTTTSSSDESSVDYYGDDYYDTDGNATLIKEEKIIYNSEEMQFIAVTTKDGSVFYVLINYSAEGDEDNVYFLNKVDDYDLYTLLYQDNEESEDGGNTNPSEAAAQAANRATNGKSGGNAAVTTTATSQAEQAEQIQNSSSGMNSMLLLIVGLVVLVGGGFAVFKFTKGKSKKKSSVDDFDGFDSDDDFDDITTGDDSEDKE